VEAQLLADDAVVPLGVAGGAVDDVDEDPRRSTWRRNAWPSPAPDDAPSMRPGTSGDRHPAILGVVEVEHAEVRLERRERVGRDLRRAAVSAARSVDFPAFGRPTRPTSAIRRSSRRSQRSSPGSPSGRAAASGGSPWRSGRCRARRGRPGRSSPPGRLPRGRRGARRNRSSRTPVPGGTVRTRSSPAFPCRFCPVPRPPGVARKWCL